MIYPWQKTVWNTLQQARSCDHLPHALLFKGEAGCGNDDFMQTLAQGLLCLQPLPDGMPCSSCRSCQVFAAKAHPDYWIVELQEDKQAIVIEQIRELNHFLGLSRSYSPRRIAVIQPAERMNTNAANSLLKSLEEPTANTHILLLTEQAASLLPTIRSRCQGLRLPTPPKSLSLQWLKQHTLQHEPESLLQLAHGRPLAALALDTVQTVSEHQQWLQHLGQVRLKQANLVDISSYWEKYDKNLLLDWQLDSLQKILKQTFFPSNREGLDELKTIQANLSQSQAWAIYDALLDLRKLANHPLNPRAFIESMLILWHPEY